MVVEQSNLENVIGNLAYNLVEFVGKCWSMVGHSMGLEDRGWSRSIEEDDAVLICHFSWKSGSFL